MAAIGGVQSHAAEAPVYSLDAVVVTANRTETKELDTNADVSVVTREEIENNHYQDITDAVKNIPGVSMMNQGANGQTYFSNSLYINGSKNVVLLVDGMRQNINGMSIGSHAQPGSFVNMDSVDRIEVLKGAASTLYGSDAQGGVINIITRKPKDGEVSSKVGVSFGSYDGEKYNLYNEGSKDGFFWIVDAQKQLQGDFKDGWGRDVVNHLNSKALNVKLGKDLGNDSDITFGYQKYKVDYTIPGTDENYLSGSNSKIRANGAKDVERLSAQYNAKINDRLKNQFSLYRNRTKFNDNSAGIFALTVKTVGVSDQLTYQDSGHTITGGVDYYKDTLDKYFSDPGMGVIDTGAQGKSATNTAFYIQDVWQFAPKWDLTPGIRVDHSDHFGNHTSPSFVLGYRPNDKTKFYTSYKEFFVAPDIYQMYTKALYQPWYTDKYSSYYVGNPNLKPEKGYTIEFGAHHQFDETLYGTFSVYQQHWDNRIIQPDEPISVDDQNYIKTYTYLNVGSVDAWGWNAQLKKEFNEHISASIGYTYAHTDKYSSDSNTNLDGLIPESTLDVSLNYTNARLDASLSGHGIMNRKGAKKSPAMEDYGNFWVWDAVINYQVVPEALLYVRVNNIFDQFYTNNASGISDLAPDNYWYSQPGRNFEAGVQFKF